MWNDAKPLPTCRGGTRLRGGRWQLFRRGFTAEQASAVKELAHHCAVRSALSEQLQVKRLVALPGALFFLVLVQNLLRWCKLWQGGRTRFRK